MASLGDFYINFVAKTEEVNKALKETNRKFSVFTKGLGKNVLSTAFGILTANSIAKLQTGREKVTAMADEMAKLARQLNVSMGDLFAFGEAAARTGSSAKNLQNSLVNISKRLTTVQIGDRGAKPIKEVFEELNVEMFESDGKFRNLVDILRDLNRAVQQFSDDSAKTIGYLGRLGIDDKTARLIQMPTEEFEALIERQKLLGAYTEASAAKIEKFNDLLSDFNQIVSVLTVELGSKLIPVMNAILMKIVAFLSYFSPQAAEKRAEKNKLKQEALQEKVRDLIENPVGFYKQPMEDTLKLEDPWGDKLDKKLDEFFKHMYNSFNKIFEPKTNKGKFQDKQLSMAIPTSRPMASEPRHAINNTLAVQEINIQIANGDPDLVAKEIENSLESSWKRLASRSLSGLKS